MKLVIQNPHYLSDTYTTGIHNYGIELLLRFRPAVRIWPLHNFVRWFRFLRLKKLPLTGWTYVLGEEALRSYDVWLNLNAQSRVGSALDPLPVGFNGLKILHLMDYAFHPREDEERARKHGLDYVLGYARHDRHCAFFRQMHPFLEGRVVPVPFGYHARFHETISYRKKENRCSVMGAVVPMQPPSADEPELSDYFAFFLGKSSAHEMRWHIREQGEQLDSSLVSFLPKPPETRSWSYDSVLELNRHRFFLNDDSIMHYPPARTYEGLACGSIMLAAREPVYKDFAFVDGQNCLMYKPGDYDALRRVLREAIHDTERCQVIHDQTRLFADRFSHRNVGIGLYRQIEHLWHGELEAAQTYWSHAEKPKT